MKASYRKKLAAGARMWCAACMAALTVAAEAANYGGTCGAALNWSLDTEVGDLLITGSGPMTNYTRDTKAPWYPYLNSIKRILVSDEATTIGNYAFYNLYVADTAHIGDKVESIGSNGFYSCSRLKSVHLPTSCRKLGNYAFAYCYALERIVLNEGLETIGFSAFRYASKVRELVLPSTVTSMDNYAFSGMSGVVECRVAEGNKVYDSRDNCNAIIRTSDNSVRFGFCTTTFPKTVTAIGSSAFCECTSLQSIDIPENVRSLGSSAFQSCSALTTVSVTDSLTQCGSAPFYDCNSLTAPIWNKHFFIRLPPKYEGAYAIADGVTEIIGGACADCSRLTSISLPEGIREVGSTLFQYCYDLQKVSLPSTINRIGSQAFYYCRKLEAVTIPDSVSQIEWGAFYGCTRLRSISMPAALSWMSSGVFTNCDSLQKVHWNVRSYYMSESDSAGLFYNVRRQITSFTFGDSVRSIPTYICYCMSALKTMEIPENVEEVGMSAFKGCYNIDNVTWNAVNCRDFQWAETAPFFDSREQMQTFSFGSRVRHVPANLCNGMSALTRLSIPATVDSIGRYAFRGVSGLESIEVAAGNKAYNSKNNCNALIETKTNTLLLGCKNTTVPSDVTTIDDYAFRDCTGLRHIDLPAGLTSIGSDAFFGCSSLDSIVIPDRVKHIRNYTFCGCSSLQSITLGKSVESIGVRAFNRCAAAETLTLPASLKRIDEYAFSECSGLQGIYLNATTAPAITASTFLEVSAPVYVPCEALASYRNAPVWNTMTTRVRGQREYVLTVYPNDLSFGQANIVQQPDCEHDAIVEAVPAAGYVFVHWIDVADQVVSTQNPYTFALTENTNLTAVFTLGAGLEEQQVGSVVAAEGRSLIVTAPTAVPLTVCDLTGRVITSQRLAGGSVARIDMPAAGLYLVRIGAQVSKVIVK